MVNTIALPAFVLGYHGCDNETAESVLNGHSNSERAVIATTGWDGAYISGNTIHAGLWNGLKS